jgi:uncharacterized protein
MKFRFYAIKLALVIILIFIAQILIPNFTDTFLLSQEHPEQIWRFMSAIFLHGSTTHLIFNLFGLVLFGSILELLIGGKRFLLVFIMTGILANVFAINFYQNSLGASGAIFGIIGALIILKPLMIVWTYGLPMPIFLAGIFWAGADVLGVFGYGSQGIGNLAHLSGMFFGLLFGAYYKKLVKRKNRKRKLTIDERAIQNWEDNYMR